MQIKNIDLNIMFSPYTIDTYSTFTFENYEEREIEWYNEEYKTAYNYDDFDWTYNNQGLVKQLALNWLKLTRDNIIDDVILAIEPDGEPYSPREYNFSTDNQNIIFTVNHDNLLSYIKNNQDHYEKNKIQSCSGFWWFGDDDQTMLHYYLAHKSVNEYSSDSYYSDQIELLESNGQIEEFIQFKFIPKIIKVEHTSDTEKSVQIDFGEGMVLWFDVWKDDAGEITGDWNKYIFLVGNEEDDKIKAFQDANNNEAGAYNFATALELVETVLESQ